VADNKKGWLVDIDNFPRDGLKDYLVKLGLWNAFAEEGNPAYSMDAAWILAKRFNVAIVPQEHKGGFYWIACVVNYIEDDKDVLIHVKRDAKAVCDNAPEAIVRAILIFRLAEVY